MASFELFLRNLWSIWVEAASWLLIGLVVAGLLKAWFPTRLLQHWLSGRGLLPIVRSAVLGTPLPLCSCSVLPAAIQLRRSGASKGATVSFLVATPENGADSIAISYVLLGPLMTIMRVVAALVSAVTAGVLTAWFCAESDAQDQPSLSGVKSNDCCTGDSCGTASELKPEKQSNGTTLNGLRYAFTDLFNDMAVWLLLGITVAAVIRSFMPPSVMAEWGSGLLAMLVIVAISIPMYICATASTPVAASLMLSGVSPGTVLVFLLAGPASNISSVGLVKRELGLKALAAYLVGVIGVSLLIGLVLDWFLVTTGISVIVKHAQVKELIPIWFAVTAGVLLALLTTFAVFNRLRSWIGRSWRFFDRAALGALHHRLIPFSEEQRCKDQGGV